MNSSQRALLCQEAVDLAVLIRVATTDLERIAVSVTAGRAQAWSQIEVSTCRRLATG
jgi:hypothetical protein